MTDHSTAESAVPAEVASGRDAWLHAQLTARIDNEFDRLGHRMTWLIGSNAFLFTGFLISLSGASREDAAMGGVERLLALAIVASVALYVCYVSYISMAVAREVIGEMKNRREHYERRVLEPLGVNFTIAFPNAGGERLGNVIYRNVPMAFAAAWLSLLAVAVSVLIGPLWSPIFLLTCALLWIGIVRGRVERAVRDMRSALGLEQNDTDKETSRSPDS